MAETEVIVSVEDMVVMKNTEEESVKHPHNQSKTQLILQLPPINAGVENESSETDAAIVAVETQDDTSAEGEDLELGFPITCGESKAILIFKKFVCPGINVKCVKYENQLMSPKQFVHMSGKATLKDWKRAIRMGGVMLRKIMDSGQLDFYEHSTLCTNTCRSTKFDLLINNTRFPPDGSGLSTPISAQGHTTVGNGGQTVKSEEKEDVLTSQWTTEAEETLEKKDTADISEETLSFWKGIADVGLIGEVVSNISSELLGLLRGVQLRSDQSSLQDAEIAVLSNLAQVFDLLEPIRQILHIRRQMTDPEQKHVLRALTTLERQLMEQKRQQSLGSLMLQPTSPAKRAPKRPRLHRPASTTQALSLQPQQFTVLSPFTLSSILSQTSSAVALHTIAPGSQFFTRLTAAPDGKGEAIAIHPSSGLALLGPAGVSPVVMQEGVVNQTDATLIQIHPAAADHSVSVMELQLDGDDRDHMEVVQGQTESEEVRLETNGVPIVVVEEEAQDSDANQ